MNLFPDVRQQALMDDADSVFEREREPSRVLEDWSSRGWFSRPPTGDGLVDQALLFRVLGRHLGSGPFLALTLAAGLAAECGDEELSRRVATGQELVALAQADVVGLSEVGATTAGTFRVFDAPQARYVLVMSPHTVALVERSERDSLHMRRCIDPSTSMGILTLGARALYLGDHDWWMRGGVLVAAMAAGVAEATRDESALHARTRLQFGKPIGTFQAIKHRCSEMAIQAEAAWCQVAFAALSLGAGHEDAPDQVSAAKVVASAAALSNASANIQNHGALGCTTEHTAHLYLKRAWILEYLCGTSDYHQGQLLEGALLQ